MQVIRETVRAPGCVTSVFHPPLWTYTVPKAYCNCKGCYRSGLGFKLVKPKEGPRAESQGSKVTGSLYLGLRAP